MEGPARRSKAVRDVAGAVIGQDAAHVHPVLPEPAQGVAEKRRDRRGAVVREELDVYVVEKGKPLASPAP